MTKVSGSPFTLDWTNLKSVCDYCDRLNRVAKPLNKCVVVKRKDMSDYTITFEMSARSLGQEVLHPNRRLQ